jgi:hypothetical protein
VYNILNETNRDEVMPGIIEWLMPIDPDPGIPVCVMIDYCCVAGKNSRRYS